MTNYKWYSYVIHNNKQYHRLIIDELSGGYIAVVDLSCLLNCIETYSIFDSLVLSVFRSNTSSTKDDDSILYTLSLDELFPKFPLLRKFCLDYKPEVFV